MKIMACSIEIFKRKDNIYSKSEKNVVNSNKNDRTVKKIKKTVDEWRGKVIE